MKNAGQANGGTAAPRKIHGPALVSVLISALLILIGVARLASYSRETPLGRIVGGSPLFFLGYDPDSLFHAQFFKVLATPSVVGMQYFLFRFLNRDRGAPRDIPVSADWRKVDFSSPWLRLVLTSLATMHWVIIELAKFNYPESFFPYSPMESRTINFAVLLVGQAFAFFGMKYLCFEPLRRRVK